VMDQCHFLHQKHLFHRYCLPARAYVREHTRLLFLSRGLPQCHRRRTQIYHPSLADTCMTTDPAPRLLLCLWDRYLSLYCSAAWTAHQTRWSNSTAFVRQKPTLLPHLHPRCRLPRSPTLRQTLNRRVLQLLNRLLRPRCHHPRRALAVSIVHQRGPDRYNRLSVGFCEVCSRV